MMQLGLFGQLALFYVFLDSLAECFRSCFFGQGQHFFSSSERALIINASSFPFLIILCFSSCLSWIDQISTADLLQFFEISPAFAQVICVLILGSHS